MIYTNANERLIPVIRNGRRQILLGTPLAGKKKIFSLIPEDDIVGLAPKKNHQYTINLMARGPHKLAWETTPENHLFLLLFADKNDEIEGEIQVLESDLAKIETIEASQRRNQQVRLLRVQNTEMLYIRVKHCDKNELLFINKGEVFKLPLYGFEPLLDEIKWHSV